MWSYPENSTHEPTKDRRKVSGVISVTFRRGRLIVTTLRVARAPYARLFHNYFMNFPDDNFGEFSHSWPSFVLLSFSTVRGRATLPIPPRAGSEAFHSYSDLTGIRTRFSCGEIFVFERPTFSRCVYPKAANT